MTRPSTARQRVNLIGLSIVAVGFLGWFIANPGRELVEEAYNETVVKGCIVAVTDAQEAYKAAQDAFPVSADLAIVAGRYLVIEERLTAVVASTRCPTVVADKQAAFLAVNRELIGMLRYLAVGGQPDHEKVQGLSDRAAVAWVAFLESLKKYAEGLVPAAPAQ